MQNGRVLSAALALAMVCAIPGTSALDLGGEALAAKADRKNSEKRKNRKNKNRNKKRKGDKTAKRDKGNGETKQVRDVRRDFRERRLLRDYFRFRNDYRFRDEVRPRRPRRFARHFRQDRFRDDFRPRRHRRFERRFNNDRFCMRPRRIERRLFRQGWDVYSFRRAGRNFEASARNRHGHRHSLTVDGCNGNVIAARNVEPRRKSKLKRTLRKIRKTFKKIF